MSAEPRPPALPTQTCPQCHFSFPPRTEAAAPAGDGQAPAPSGTVSVLGPDDVSVGAGAATAAPVRVSRFEVRRFLGEGAFGRVYEAYDPALRRAVALKVAKASARRTRVTGRGGDSANACQGSCARLAEPPSHQRLINY